MGENENIDKTKKTKLVLSQFHWTASSTLQKGQNEGWRGNFIKDEKQMAEKGLTEDHLHI